MNIMKDKTNEWSRTLQSMLTKYNITKEEIKEGTNEIHPKQENQRDNHSTNKRGS